MAKAVKTTNKVVKKATVSKSTSNVTTKASAKPVTKNTSKVASKSNVRKTTVKSVSKPQANKARGLGMGLGNLLGSVDSLSLDNSLNEPVSKESVRYLKLTELQAGKYQPRTIMEEEALKELSDSIKEQGIMQPLLVRAISTNKYEIIAGERRFRAAKLAGLEEVPVLIKDVADKKAAIMSLIENMQREDLNPLEEALGINRLIEEFRLTHEQAAQAVGRSRSFASNLLRLLKLAQPVQELLMKGSLDMGHARSLVTLDAATQIILANQVVSKNLSVRETEKLVSNTLQGKSKTSQKKKSLNPDTVRVQKLLEDYLNTKVQIKTTTKQKGALIIEFANWEHLNSLFERLNLSEVLE